MQKKHKASKTKPTKTEPDSQWCDDTEVQVNSWSYVDDEPDLLNFTSQCEDNSDMRFFN